MPVVVGMRLTKWKLRLAPLRKLASRILQSIGEREALLSLEIVVEVTARDQDTATAPVRSAPSALGNSPPLIVSNPAALTNREQYEYVVQAKDVDGDTVIYGLETGPPGMTIDKSTGQVIWKVIPGVAGTHRVKIMAEDGQGGIAWQEFELSIPSTAQSQMSLPSQG